MESSLAESGGESPWNESKLSSPSSNENVACSTLATIFETLVPLRVVVGEGLYYVQQQQHATSFLQQFPQPQPPVLPVYRNWLSIFIAYAYKDQRFLPKIDEILHAIKYQISNIGWQFGEIAKDTSWKEARHDYLKTTSLILLLITPAFVATEYCYCDQLRWAIIRHRQELSCVIPVLLQACLWDQTPFAGLTSITPNNRKAVDKWGKPNLAYEQIAFDIRNAVIYLKQRQ